MTPRQVRPSRSVAPVVPTPNDRPRWLLGPVSLLLVLAPLIPTEGVGQGTGAMWAMGWCVLLLASTAVGLIDRRPWQLDRVDGWALAFAAWIGVVALPACRVANARATLNVSWHWLALLSSFLLVRRQWLRPVDRRALVSVMIAVTTALAAVGIYQFAVGMPRDRAEYFSASESVKRERLRENGIDPDTDSPQRKHFEDRLNSTEPTATFALANSLAGVLATWLIVAVSLLTDGPSPKGWWRVGRWCVLFVILVCLVLTKSRAAWIAAAVGGAGMLLLVPQPWGIQRRVWIALAGLAVTAMFAGYLSGAIDRQVFTEAWLSLRYRGQYWIAALHMIADHPWWGCGPGNFQDYYARYKLPQASEMVADPHCFLLEIGATMGLPGLWLFFALLAATARASRRACTSGRPSKEWSAGEPSDSSVAMRPWPIYLGACVAFIASAGYRWMIAIPLETDPWSGLPVLWTVGGPVAAAVLWGGHRWVRHGTLPNRFLWLGLGGMALNLTVAGGISYGGVAQSFWLLAALAASPAGKLVADETAPPPTSHRSSHRLQAGAVIGVVVAGAITWACFITEYRPVLQSQQWLSSIQHMAGRPESIERALRNAALADPWDPEPQRLLAEFISQRWALDPRGVDRAGWEQALAEALRRDPQSYLMAWQAGRLWLRAYRAAGDAADLERALEAYRRAAMLYPHGNLVHAQVAWVAHLAGQDDLAREAASRALALDRQNPHWEQGLAQRAIEDPGPALGQSGQPSGPPAASNAEQLMQQLRNSP